MILNQLDEILVGSSIICTFSFHWTNKYQFSRASISYKKLFYKTDPSTQKIIFRVGQNSGFSRARKPIEILDFSVANGFAQMVLWLQLGEKNLRLNINNLKIDSKLSHRCKVYKKNLWGKSHFLWLDPNLCFFREDARNEVDSLNSVKWMLYFVIKSGNL